MRIWQSTIIFISVLITSGLTMGQATNPATSISISAIQDSVKMGTPLEIQVILTNKTHHDLTVGREISGMDCHVDIRDLNGKLPADTRFGYPRNGHADDANLLELSPGELHTNALYIPVKAGKTLRWKLDVNKLYVLNRPGEYRVQVWRRDSGDPSILVKSNTIPVTLTP